MKKINIPVGISDFEKIRNGDFYYIDKTLFIKEILDNRTGGSDTDYPSSALRKNARHEYAGKLL